MGGAASYPPVRLFKSLRGWHDVGLKALVPISYKFRINWLEANAHCRVAA